MKNATAKTEKLICLSSFRFNICKRTGAEPSDDAGDDGFDAWLLVTSPRLSGLSSSFLVLSRPGYMVQWDLKKQQIGFTWVFVKFSWSSSCFHEIIEKLFIYPHITRITHLRSFSFTTDSLKSQRSEECTKIQVERLRNKKMIFLFARSHCYYDARMVPPVQALLCFEKKIF